ncbi:MAG: hypothetical protein ABR498_05850 [Candidatus Dormibacteria bacterium]
MLAVTACGGASSATPTPAPTATATSTPTPLVTPPPTATPRAGLNALELAAPSLSDDVMTTSKSCDSFLTLLPSGSDVEYGEDCQWFAARAGGPLDPLLTAPAGTLVRWHDSGGHAFHTMLDGNVSTIDRDPSNGEYGGHGVGSPTAFFWIRTSTNEKEVSGPLMMGDG